MPTSWTSPRTQISAGESTLVFVGELDTPDLTGTLYRWEAGTKEVMEIAEGFVVADG